MGCGHGGRGFRVEKDGQCITMTTLLKISRDLPKTIRCDWWKINERYS